MSDLKPLFSETDNEDNQKEKIDFAIAIVVIFVFGAFILLMTFPIGNTLSDTSSTEVSEKLLSTPNDLETDTDLEILSTAKTAKVSHEIVPVATHPNGHTFEFNSIENDSVKENPVSETLVLNDSVPLKDSIPTVLTSLVEKKENIVIEADKKETEIKEAKVKIIDSPDSHSINQKIAIPQKSKEIPNLNTRVGQEIFTGIEEDCIILVGVFSNTENANRIIDALQKDGYETFRSPYKNLTRTGIKLNCRQQEAREILKQVQTNHNSNAYLIRRKDL